MPPDAVYGAALSYVKDKTETAQKAAEAAGETDVAGLGRETDIHHAVGVIEELVYEKIGELSEEQIGFGGRWKATPSPEMRLPQMSELALDAVGEMRLRGTPIQQIADATGIDSAIRWLSGAVVGTGNMVYQTAELASEGYKIGMLTLKAEIGEALGEFETGRGVARQKGPLWSYRNFSPEQRQRLRDFYDTHADSRVSIVHLMEEREKYQDYFRTVLKNQHAPRLEEIEKDLKKLYPDPRASFMSLSSEARGQWTQLNTEKQELLGEIEEGRPLTAAALTTLEGGAGLAHGLIHMIATGPLNVTPTPLSQYKRVSEEKGGIPIHEFGLIDHLDARVGHTTCLLYTSPSPRD